MGLIKAFTGAVGGVLADQWKEYFYCDSIAEDTLAVKGQKRVSGRSSNTKGEENIISDGAVIAVNEGQCMLIVEQGKVVEVSAEPGEYRFDKSTEPTVFSGSFGKSLIESFKTVGKRFTFGGDTAKDQRVYYINTKEIVGNKYGTPTPIPFRVVDRNIGLDMDIAVRCNGEYSYKVADPIVFFTNLSGNVEGDYRRDRIDSQLKTELLTALQPAFAKISEMGVRYSALPAHTIKIADALNEVLSKKWLALRGIAVASFGINSVSASEEDEDAIKELQRRAVMRDPSMAAATLAGAQAEAMTKAAENSAGAMTGFMGFGMAQQAGGIKANELFAMAKEKDEAEAAKAPANGTWACTCGSVNSGKFCPECGNKKPQGGFCPECGAKVSGGKFCPECGNKL